MAAFILLLFFFPFSIFFAYMLHDIAHLLVAYIRRRQRIYGQGCGTVNSLSCYLGNMVLKICAVSLVSANAQFLIQRVYASFAVLAHSSALYANSAISRLYGAVIPTLYMPSFLAVLGRQFPVDCFQCLPYPFAHLCLKIFSQLIFSVNIIFCGLYYIHYFCYYIVIHGNPLSVFFEHTL